MRSTRWLLAMCAVALAVFVSGCAHHHGGYSHHYGHGYSGYHSPYRWHDYHHD